MANLIKMQLLFLRCSTVELYSTFTTLYSNAKTGVKPLRNRGDVGFSVAKAATETGEAGFAVAVSANMCVGADLRPTSGAA